jgi:hypothetical protein
MKLQAKHLAELDALAKELQQPPEMVLQKALAMLRLAQSFDVLFLAPTKKP